MSVLDSLVFEPMYITDVFDEYRQAPAWLNTNEVKQGASSFAHVTNTALRNSVARYIPEQRMRPNPGNAITVGIDTQVVAYQPMPFYGATKVFQLRSDRLTEKSALVLVGAIRQGLEKFSWGYKASANRLKRTRIMVPVAVDSGGRTVNWDGLERLGDELFAQVIARTHAARQARAGDDDSLPNLRFAPMFITDVFDTMAASTAWYDKTKLDMAGTATHPFVSRTKASNGVDGFCPRQGKTPESGNAVTIGLDTQTIGYQPVPFYTSQNIQVLRHGKLDEYSGPVLVTLLDAQMGKFNWGGSGATLGRLRKTRIMVPVVTGPDGEPVADWEGMSTFGQALRVRVERNLVPVLGPPDEPET